MVTILNITKKKWIKSNYVDLSKDLFDRLINVGNIDINYHKIIITGEINAEC